MIIRIRLDYISKKKKAAINIAHNSVKQDQTKDIEIDKTFYQGNIVNRIDLYSLCEDGGNNLRIF